MNLSPYITAAGSLNTGAAADRKLIEPVAGRANGATHSMWRLCSEKRRKRFCLLGVILISTPTHSLCNVKSEAKLSLVYKRLGTRLEAESVV